MDEAAAESNELWVSSYCALPGGEPQPHLTVREWAEPVEVSQPLPTLPLFLRADQLWVTVDLESTYQATLRAGRYNPT